MSKLQQVGGMEASREIAQVSTYCADDAKAFVLSVGLSRKAEADADTRD